MGIDGHLRRAVFLDRDGVINRAAVRDRKPYPPATEAELEVLPGVPEALARLRQAGYRLIVVTNQPDVARGTQRQDVVERMHARLLSALPLDEIRMCAHDNRHGCRCRKPKPGMLEDAARDLGLDLASSYMVGDRSTDVEAAHRAGCTAIFVDYDYDEPRPERPDAIVGSLAEAADWILSRVGAGRT